MDNFRRKKHHRNRSGSIDGFINSGPSIPTSGLNNRGAAPPATGSLSDFRRADGFHSSSQTILSNTARPAIDRQPARDAGGNILLGQKPVEKKKKHKKERSRRYKIIKRGVLTILTLFILIGGFVGWKFIRNTNKVFQGGIFGLFDSTKLKGEEKGRVNILLTGTSEDDPGHAGAMLTDSIMLISIDTNNKSGFIMSIPRDLWIDYGTDDCSYGTQGKINVVYQCGEEVEFKQSGYPDGGVGLMEKVVEENFGLDLNYFVKINYTAFRDAVNSVGGIDFTVRTNDPRGIYDGNISKAEGGPLKLTNGTHHLNGQTALNLARARCATVCYGFERGDFDRTENQRKMIVALKDKALSAGVLSNPAKISNLFDAVGNNVKTDFQTNEIRRLYDIGKQIQNNNIKSVGLADEEVNLVTTANVNGLSVVRPVAGTYDFSDIQAFIKRLTSSDPVVREGASVVVLNGSEVSGLAKKKADELEQKGLIVEGIANSATKPTTTVMALSNDKPSTKAYLERKFKVTSTNDTVANPEARNYDADFVIILGQNEANSNQTQTP